MKYISIDIETTGLDPDTCQILEIGAIYYQSGVGELDRFHCYIDHEKFVGEPYALWLNSHIFKTITDSYSEPNELVMTPNKARKNFGNWLSKLYLDNDKRKLVPAGKNFASFDRQFLLKLMPSFTTMVGHKTLDPGSMYVNKDDTSVPGLPECLRRVGLKDTVTHHALDDAQQVIDLIESYWDI